MNKKCLLCKESSASSIKSHIIPKFIGKDLISENKMLVLSKDDKAFYQSDLPKRGGIFCVDCEKKFNTVETLASRVINDFRIKCYEKFTYCNMSYLDTILKMNMNTEVFNLFLLSILWRVSVSDDYLFKSIKLPNKIENGIRKILNYNLKPFIKDYSTFNNYNKYLDFFLVFKKPINMTPSSRGGISLLNPSKGVYVFNLPFFQISLVENGSFNTSFSKDTMFNHELSNLYIIINQDFIFKQDNYSPLKKFEFSRNTIDRLLSKIK
ncbi:hypothetical protein [Myroides marinus]|nr:hypothetical protein [Myroides marinus]